MGYAAAFGTAFNYNAYSWAGTIIAPGVISIYSTLQPIGTAVLSFMFLGAKTTLGEILGGVLVIVGLIITVAARDIESKLAKKKAAAEAAAANGENAPLPSKFSPKNYGGARRESNERPLIASNAEEEEDERI